MAVVISTLGLAGCGAALNQDGISMCGSPRRPISIDDVDKDWEYPEKPLLGVGREAVPFECKPQVVRSDNEISGTGLVVRELGEQGPNKPGETETPPA